MPPKATPLSKPAMVALKVVLAGGAGMSFDEACEKIFQEFDPPIVDGTYSSVSSARQADVKKFGEKSKYRSGQSEHAISNTSFQSRRGDNSSNIKGAKGYTEGSAYAYSVYDGQSRGTEHKFLTDAARDYDKGPSTPASPTLKERLAACKEWTKKSLLKDLQREERGTKRSRIKDAKKRSPKDREKLAEAASECITRRAEAQFKKQKVKASTPTRRGLDASTRAKKKALKAASKPGKKKF